jgi:outer membrane lipoprotein SlyB
VNEASSTASRAAPAKLHPLLVAAALSVIGASALAAVALINGHVAARHLAGAEQAVVASAPAPQTPAAADAAPPPTVAAPAPASKPAAPKRVAKPAPAPVAAATPATTTVPAAPMPPPPAAPVCRDCGTVTAIREVQTPGSANGVGAIAGGVVGGVIGNQIGKGSGRDAARILGAIGGAVAGHQIEKHARTTTRYDIEVRMDDGQLRTISRSTPPELRIGDAVRLQGDTLLLHDGRPVAERPQPAPLDRGGA